MNTSLLVKKRINYKAVLALIGILVALGAAVHFVHAFQVKRNASNLREQAAVVEKEGKLKEAKDFWSQYVGLMPEDTDALVQYGTLLEKMAKVPAGRAKTFAMFENVLRREPQRSDIRRRQIDIAIAVDRIPDAKAHIQILLQANPDDPELLQRMATCLVLERKEQDASEWYEKATKGSKSIDVFLEYAYVLRKRLDRPDQADAQIDNMVRVNETSAKARFEAARYYKIFKVWDKTEKHAKAAIALNSQEPEVFLFANEAALAQGRKKEALAYLKQGEKMHPNNADIALAIVRADRASGDVKEALNEIKKGPINDIISGAKTTAPSSTRELINVTELLMDLGQTDQARDMIKRLRDKHTPLAADFLQARLALQLGNWAEARQRFEDVRQNRQAPPELFKYANLFLAKCYKQLGNLDLEYDACKKALQRTPNWLDGRVALASCLADMGKTEEAIREYQHLVEERVPGMRIELARLRLILNLRKPPEEQDWASVEQTLQAIPAGEPGEVVVQLLRADLLVAQKKYDEARPLAEAARDRDPKQFAPWMFLINLSQIQGQTQRTRELIEQAERATGKLAEWALSRMRLEYRFDTPGAFKQLLQQIEQGQSQYPDDEKAKLLFGLADGYILIGDRDGALRLWHQVADRLPHDVWVRFRLLEATIGMKRESDARHWLEEVKRIEGKGGALGEYGEAALLLMRAAGRDKSGLASARQHLVEAARLRPSWARVPLLEATLLEMENQMDKALEKYQAALDRGETRLSVIQHMVRLLHEKGRYTEANNVLKKLPDETLATAGLKQLRAELDLLDPEATKNQDPADVRAHALDMARKAVKQQGADYKDYLWLGLIAGAAEQPKEAENALRTALKMKPDAPETWVALVSLLARTDALKAEVELRNAQNALSKEQSTLVLSTGYEALGKTAEAEDNYKAALQAHPTDLTLLRNAANFYRRNGQPAKAVVLLQKVLEPATAAPEPVVAWARRNLALSLASGGGYQSFKQAQALLEANHKQFGDTEEDKRTSALVLATQPQHRSDAIKQFEQLSARRDLAPETMFVLAQLYEADGNWQAANWKLKRLVQNHENNTVFLAHLAALLLRHKQHDEALPYVVRLSKLKPNQLETVMLYTRVLKEQGNTEKALSVARDFASAGNPPQQAAYLFEDLREKNQAENYFRTYVAAAPDRPERALTLAGFLGRNNRTDEALDICDKAWDKCAPEAVALTAVGLVRLGKASDGQERQIDNRLQAAIAKNPDKRVLLQLRAEFVDYCGRTDDAIALYRELVQAQPRNIAALNNLAVLLALREGQGEEALRRINAAIEIAGPVAQLLDTRAMVYLSEKRPDMAIKDLDDALKQEPSPLFYFHQARAYNMSRNRPEALKCWEKATAHDGLNASALPRLERPTFDSLRKELAGS